MYIRDRVSTQSTGSGRSRAMPTPLLRAKSARAPELRQEEDRRAENIANRMSETALRKKLESLFRPLFHMIDTDDDHSITLDEFRKVITTSFPGHKEKEAELMKLWWIDQDKEGMAKPLTAKGWVKQWCRYMRDTGTQHTKELLLATMVAINTNSDNANMTRVLSGCQESMIPMPSPRLSLSDCQDMKELVDTLWKTLDFGVGESGKNDVLDEFEMSFLKVPALHDIMSKLDTNADGCVSYIEWANFWDCLLYTSDAADEEDSVDLGGRRIIKKKKK
eukprot:TRINITY_DN11112_c0_g1_i6.p1 TRINITY_DN11112_c0_g1~~TRINITY_DN11112_c0_g1_i6.p1  ORF type:complete len:288 (+),score=88.57 TRINITY_DN11112_c0_g1_i6:36-866(+)